MGGGITDCALALGWLIPCAWMAHALYPRKSGEELDVTNVTFLRILGGIDAMLLPYGIQEATGGSESVK